jgi:riboflavin kinase/FMN adenylyltransferase
MTGKMRIQRDSKDFMSGGRSTAVGLGTFDGLHIGHRKLIDTLLEEARARGLEPMVYTFTGEPDDILRKGCHTHVLTDFESKARLLESAGVGTLCVDEFTPEYARTEAETFVSDILVGRLGMKLAVCGFNYTFGRYRKGDVAMLESLKHRFGFDLIVIPPVEAEGEIVSSTLIRKTVSTGDVEKAARLLGRPFELTGTVVAGRRVGRSIGIPTANLEPEPCMAVPARGVYCTRTLAGGKTFDSVTNIGFRPTFETSEGGDRVGMVVETHLLDGGPDLYGKEIRVRFLKRLRAERKFADTGRLIEQINADIAAARAYFAEPASLD